MVTATQPPMERRERIHLSSRNEVTPQVASVIRRALKAGGPTLDFPTLTGKEAAALMKAAGIVDKNGNLAKKYR